MRVTLCIILLTTIFVRQSGGAPTPIKIDTGSRSSCLKDSSDNLRCYGANQVGQLGIGNFVGFPTPKLVSSISSVSAVSVGEDFACAISNGGAFCWGKNDRGQLGNGTTNNSNLPTGVSGLGTMPIG